MKPFLSSFSMMLAAPCARSLTEGTIAISFYCGLIHFSGHR
jgi:hypothetical protein